MNDYPSLIAEVFCGFAVVSVASSDLALDLGGVPLHALPGWQRRLRNIVIWLYAPDVETRRRRARRIFDCLILAVAAGASIGVWLPIEDTDTGVRLATIGFIFVSCSWFVYLGWLVRTRARRSG